MKKSEIFEKEEIISQSNNGLITLTNLRLRYTDRVWGRSHIVSFMLKNISSVEVKYRSKPLFLLLTLAGAIGITYAMSEGEESLILWSGVAVLTGLVAYWFSRKHNLVIHSNGGAQMHFHSSKMPWNKVLDFINGLEEAIYKYDQANNHRGSL